MLGHVRSICGRKWVQNSGHVRSLCGHKGQNLGACSIQTASGNGWSVVMFDPKFVRFYTIAWLASQQRHQQKTIFTGIWSHFTIISARTLQDLQATPPTLQGIINTLNICEAMADALSVFRLMRCRLLIAWPNSQSSPSTENIQLNFSIDFVDTAMPLLEPRILRK